MRAPELIAAATFACNNLKNPDDLFKGEAALPLAAINDALPEGKTLLASARRILADIGKTDFTSISLEDVGDPARIFADTVFNGDGVITEMAAEDDATRALIREIGETRRRRCRIAPASRASTAALTDAFFAEARAYSAWYARGEESPANVFPLGPERTAAAAAAVTAIKPKVDDYFGRCRLAAFDPRALPALNRNPEEYLPIAADRSDAHGRGDRRVPAGAGGSGSAAAARRRGQPGPRGRPPVVARRRRGAAAGPAHRAHRERLARARSTSSRPYDAWLAVKEGLPVEKLGIARVREILASGGAEALTDLIARDKALEAEAASIDQVERLVRYHRDLAHLCTNFVSFEDFYDGRQAIFQYGTLYLDQRACHLCLPVTDAAKHATMAGLAGAFLAYLDCTRPATAEKMQIVAAFTAGESDNLMVGRNGVFYDRQGRDWDATITKIVDNPISLRQAFWAPYKKFVRLLEEQVAKRAAAADTESHAMLTTTAAGTANIGNAKPPETKKIDVGTVAALGVAVGAIGTFVTALIGYATGLFKLGPLATMGAFVGIMLLISMPSVVLAYIKLRKRNLGPILDANGWAVNARAKINVPFGATLSSVAKLPRGSRRDTSDRYAEKSPPWKSLLFVVLLLYGAYAWWQGKLDRVLPQPARSSTILR